ncbi:uncharacterized protein LOC144549477 isoform X1 [Carex rostrata]
MRMQSRNFSCCKRLFQYLEMKSKDPIMTKLALPMMMHLMEKLQMISEIILKGCTKMLQRRILKSLRLTTEAQIHRKMSSRNSMQNSKAIRTDWWLGVLLSKLAYIFDEQTPRWHKLLSQLGI